MDQEIEIINNNTRIEKIKNFLINYKKFLITTLIIIILGLFSFFSYEAYQDRSKENLANKYNLIVTKFEIGQKENVTEELKEIIKTKDKTYSPLAFYFLLDNESLTRPLISTFFSFADKIDILSTRFLNSLTFPGHSYL